MEARNHVSEIDLFDIDLSNADEISAALIYLEDNFEDTCESKGSSEIFRFLEKILATNPGAGCAITRVLLNRHYMFFELRGHQRLCANLATDILLYHNELDLAPWMDLAFNLQLYAEGRDLKLVESLILALLDDYPYCYTAWQTLFDLFHDEELHASKQEINQDCAEKLLALDMRIQLMEGYRVNRYGIAVEAKPFLREGSILYNEAGKRDDLPYELLQQAVLNEREGDLVTAHQKMLIMVNTICREDIATFFEFFAHLIRISRSILRVLEPGTEEYKDYAESIASYESQLEENRDSLDPLSRKHIDYIVDMGLSEPDNKIEDLEENILYFNRETQEAAEA